MKAAVVGSGIAGIATAIRLQVAGYQVDVYEKNPYPGGKLTVIESDGYRFDAGPSLFTLPYLVTELFELAGKDPSDYFNYISKDVACNYFCGSRYRREYQSTGEPKCGYSYQRPAFTYDGRGTDCLSAGPSFRSIGAR